MRRWRASYTVEASIIVSVMLGVYALAMQTEIAMYEEIKGQQGIGVELCEVKEFYIYQTMGEIVKDES